MTSSCDSEFSSDRIIIFLPFIHHYSGSECEITGYIRPLALIVVFKTKIAFTLLLFEPF